MSVPRRTTTSRLEAGTNPTIETSGAWTSSTDVQLTESPTNTHADLDEALLDNVDAVTPPGQAPYSLSDSDTYVPIEDPVGHPKLDFKPVMLQEWVLATMVIFCIAVAVTVGMLLFYENQARIFHVSATASRFTVRFLPPIIGTLTSLVYTSIVRTYARTLPYMEMADTTVTDYRVGNAGKTMLAEYSPRINLIQAFRNHHGLLATMTVCSSLVQLFLLPIKSSLLIKSPTKDGTWDVTIWPAAAILVILVYSSMSVMTLLLLVFMWKRRTGLKWDVVSIADYCVLFNQSNVLDDYAMVDTGTPVHQWRYSKSARHLYRLGYWRVERTKEIWYGVRREDMNTTRAKKYSPTTNGITSQHTHNFLMKPRSCYSLAFLEVMRIIPMISCIFAGSFSAYATYLLFSDRYQEGYEVKGYSVATLSIATRFVPALAAGFFSAFWDSIDVYYRLVQPFMGLRKPSPADENLLLEYGTTLPVLATLIALKAKHWRLALFTAMSLVNKLLVVVGGSVIVIEPSEATSDGLHIGFSYRAFMACLSIVLAYVVLIPFAWPGPGRRLPWLPTAISTWLYFFHAGSLSGNDVFRSGDGKDERWQMVARLRLQQQLYTFGIYPGRDGALHLGIDSAYIYEPEKVRVVVPIPPPRRLHRQWLRRVKHYVLRVCKRDIPPDQNDEEIDVTHRYWQSRQSNELDTEVTPAPQNNEIELQELHQAISNVSTSASIDATRSLLSHASETASQQDLDQSHPLLDTSLRQRDASYHDAEDYSIRLDFGFDDRLDVTPFEAFSSHDQATDSLLGNNARMTNSARQNSSRRGRTK